MQQTVIEYSYLIPLLPLLGAALAGFLGAKWLKGQSHWPIWLGVGASAVLSLMLLWGMFTTPADEAISYSKNWFTWIDVGTPAKFVRGTEGKDGQPPEPGAWVDARPADERPADLPEQLGKAPVHFVVEAGFWFDSLTAVMLSMVCGIGFLITVFAAGYMKGEEGYFRFFAYLGLFIFMMTCLVMANNLVMLYLGWEGVGLCSYLLIGYYYEKPAAREAAKKAFLVNRIGDFGFGLGIMLSFLAFGTISFFGDGAGTHTGLLELAGGTMIGGHALTAFQQHAVYWIPFLLMLGAFGKSAQFPLYVWLPDAMEGPTPVSALIHAATMVTAGVYMIARCGTLFVGNAAAMATIAAVGAFTALFAATIALRQFDLKKIFAYSTISQLGYMFVGVALWAPVAAVFHLVTHAFFKALLFLSCGVVMHAMSGVLDMRQMSGLKKVLPKTNVLIGIGCLALAGFPLTSGFFSKDMIVGASFAGTFPRIVLWLVLLLTAFLTAYYTFRLYFQVFWGPLVIPEVPSAAHAADPGAASDSAMQTGTASHSGVDKHLAADAHQAGTGNGHGATHGHDSHGNGHHNHEPALMIVPLVVLALGAAFVWLINVPGGDLGQFLARSPSVAFSSDVAAATFTSSTPEAMAAGYNSESSWWEWSWLIGAAVSVAGIFGAYWLHLRDRARAERLAADLEPLTRTLEAKYWVDEIYQASIVEPLRRLGVFCFAIDRFLIDSLISLLSWVPQAFGWILKFTVQRGSLQGYASAMLFGVVIILLLIFTR